jgi:hypothetical protein
LAAVDWDHAPAMYRGHRLHILALMALLERHDNAGALRLAAEAQALERTDPAGSLPILHDAIMLAAEECDDETIGRVKRATERKVGALPALSAWAVSLHFDRIGRQFRILLVWLTLRTHGDSPGRKCRMRKPHGLSPPAAPYVRVPGESKQASGTHGVSHFLK